MARTWLTDMALSSALVLGLALLVVADDALPTECPKSDVGNTTVNLPHETHCWKYYGCSGGKKWLKECPLMDAEGNRLHFNPILQVCDWPQNVNCKLPNQRSAVAPLAEIPKKCPKFDVANQTVHLEHESDCTKFYKCSHGKKYEMECPIYNDEGDRLVFNPETQRCDWPWNVPCKHPKPRSAVAPLAEIPTKCPKFDVANQTVHLEHESDCTKFYKCSHGKKYEMDCPVYNDEGDKLFFNVELQWCDWPENVDCKHTKPRSAVAPLADIPKKCPKFDVANQTVHLEHESDCTKFYKCSHGKKYEMDCPVYNDKGDRLFFNVELQACDWPWNVTCKHPKPRIAVALLAEIPKECPKVDVPFDPVHLAHETDCTKFYACSNGRKIEMECPYANADGDRLHFDAAAQKCDWPENAKCQ